MKLIIITDCNVFTVIKEGNDCYALKSMTSKHTACITSHQVLGGLRFYRRNKTAKIIFAK